MEIKKMEDNGEFASNLCCGAQHSALCSLIPEQHTEKLWASGVADGSDDEEVLQRGHIVLLILMLTQMALWPRKKTNGTLTTWRHIGWTHFASPPNFSFFFPIKKTTNKPSLSPMAAPACPLVLVKLSAQDDDGSHTLNTSYTRNFLLWLYLKYFIVCYAMQIFNKCHWLEVWQSLFRQCYELTDCAPPQAHMLKP